jgi:hypothetical protein
MITLQASKLLGNKPWTTFVQLLFVSLCGLDLKVDDGSCSARKSLKIPLDVSNAFSGMSAHDGHFCALSWLPQERSCLY